MHDPFESSDALIRDLAHVRVVRKAAPAGRLCRYEKIFKSDGLGEAGYWIQRENEFLLDFALKNLRHVVQLASVVRDSDGLETPVVESVVTLDAGVTIEDWLRVQPQYENGLTALHPFQHAAAFLELLRACLTALREIHRLGFVHCDIKEDNICLPYTPYPFQPGRPVLIDHERIRVIDFAFSITPERPLQYPLPILPSAPYQSRLLKTALATDWGSNRHGGTPAVQSIDYRVDLYSLGYLAGRILDRGLLQPAGPGGAAALQGAHDLVEQLKSSDNGRRRGSRGLPHDAWIEEVEGMLGPLQDAEIYRRFEIGRLRDSDDPGTPLVEATPLAPRVPAVPTVPSDLLPTLVRPKPRPGWGVIGGLVALATAGAVGVGVWQASQKPAEPIVKDAQVPPAVKPKTKPRPAPTAGAETPGPGKKPGRTTEAETQARAESGHNKAGDLARWKADAEATLKSEVALAEQDAGNPTQAAPEPPKTQTESDTQAAGPAVATAEIGFPGPGASVAKAEFIRGSLHGLGSGQSAFLVVRSTAEQYGRLFYPQGELPPYLPEWTRKAIFGTLNYEYQIFVVATRDPRSAEQLRSQESRAYGMGSLPEDTQVISKIVTVRRVE